MKKTSLQKYIFIILLFLTPLFFFFGFRFFQIIGWSDSQEPVKDEIVRALVCGIGASLGLWPLWYQVRKNGKNRVEN
ncbi:MAG: hypothetical protein LBB79_03535 [Prevotellaceae bacterium]|jgi:hypothetical protein|nr:hypothetical protein [Prevotellaceae bacterium]